MARTGITDMTKTLIESTVEAPHADAILHVLKMHAEHPRAGTVLLETLTVVALLEDYQPQDIPVTMVDACIESLRLLAQRHAHHIRLDEIARQMVPSIARTRVEQPVRDLMESCENEARTIIRHRITLEGPDL